MSNGSFVERVSRKLTHCLPEAVDHEESSVAVPMINKIKVLTIGDSGVGKSAVILKWAEDVFSPNFLTTIGIDYKMKSIVLKDGRKCKVQIWDTAGQERFRNITNAYYRGANGIILVYDVTDEHSFMNIRFWINQIEKHTDDPMIILLGNKCDLKEERQVSLQRAEELVQEYDNITHFETSAKTSKNIDEAFAYLTKQIIDKQALQSQYQENVSLDEADKKLNYLKEKIGCNGCIN